ncbi:MAG: EAL domain-containing protein [Chromatiaceae bacterium]|nr:EAL domain-containing protein [Chromatiaceae bacterium]
MEQTLNSAARGVTGRQRRRAEPAPPAAEVVQAAKPAPSGRRGEFTPEQGQAVTRALLAALGCGLLFVAQRFGHTETPFLLTAIYLLASLLYLSFVSRHRSGMLWRRYVLIVLDLGIAAYLTGHFQQAGIAFYPLFLWVMIGNGIRYGQHYMQFATLFGLLGFSAAMAHSGFLWSQPASYIGLMFGLVLMPRFFLIMFERLADANTKLKEQKERAEYMASHDTLTGLPNRAYLHTRLEQSLARARRGGQELAIAFIDLDAFKSINDSFGHEYGDYLLAQVADAMRSVIRGSDTVSRLGGDEFVVVIEDFDDSRILGTVIERLFTCVGRYYTIGEYETYVTWSCGVVVYPRDGSDIHTLLKHADTAMYAAKSRGTNQYAFYDASMSALVSEQLALRDELRLALDRNEFEVHYQPIVDAHSGRITAAEALLRWHHPQQGLLSPSTFIAVAEQSGAISEIGHWVLGQALRTAAIWQAKVDYPITMHVNVSAHQLKQDSFVDEVKALLVQSGLPSWVLDLEMTESILLEDAARAEALLAQLRDIGVRIALDDFGTGFSSLSYLKRLPIDLIKIDKSFIDDVPDDPRDCALVEVVLNIGERFDNAIVAEGVETPQQRDWLVAHGCRYLQGYLFSRAVPGAEFVAMSGEVFAFPG